MVKFEYSQPKIYPNLRVGVITVTFFACPS
jgi:hypothetical protein